MNNKKQNLPVPKVKNSSNFHLSKIYIPIEDWGKILIFINGKNSPYQTPSQFIRAAIDEKLKNEHKKK